MKTKNVKFPTYYQERGKGQGVFVQSFENCTFLSFFVMGRWLVAFSDINKKIFFFLVFFFFFFFLNFKIFISPPGSLVFVCFFF